MVRKDGIPTAYQKDEGIHLKNLFSVMGGLMSAVLNKIASKVPADLADDLNNDPAMIDAMIAGAVEYKATKLALAEKNPYEMTVEEQLAALRRANEEESRVNPNWVRIPDEVFERLASTAPAWPQGQSAYRSFRIRFGEGGDGVAKTFEAHYTRIQHVFGEGRFWRWELLHSGKVEYDGKLLERLRLLSGNHTHHAVVEWIVTDLSANRRRKSVEAVRDSKSLADELLVIAWLFPDMIRAIDYDKLPGLFAAGYEVNVPKDDGEAWQNVVFVNFNRGFRQVSVGVSGRGDSDSHYSVPGRLKVKRS